jgi:hypothetical protein
MPAVSLKQQLQSMPSNTDERAIRPLLQALLDGVQALATKLDADATVTDTNYRATLDALVTD